MAPFSLYLSLSLLPLLVTVSLSSPTRDEQLSEVISSLLSTTDFQSFATLILTHYSLSNLTATLFVPSDSSLSHLPTRFDPLLIPYHILPNSRLPLSSLSLLPPLSRLPTLLPHHYILLTNNSLSNFTVDGSPLTSPDLFLSRDFAVHGVRNVLLYSPYFEHEEGVDNGSLSNPNKPVESEPVWEENVGSVWDSGSFKNNDGFLIVFLTLFFGVFLAMVR